jgi:hypothetical protein
MSPLGLAMPPCPHFQQAPGEDIDLIPEGAETTEDGAGGGANAPSSKPVEASARVTTR